VTPDFILRTHNDGKSKVDVDRGGGHGEDRGRTLRGEDERLMGGKEKRTEERNQPTTNH